MKLSDEEKALIKKLIYEVEEALSVLELRVREGIRDLSDAYALRYALIQVVEGLAVIASRIAEAYGALVEGYVEAMKFLSRIGVVEFEVSEKLVRLARLRNLLVHRYWVIDDKDDKRILREAKENGIETIKEVIKSIQKFIEGQETI